MMHTTDGIHQRDDHATQVTTLDAFVAEVASGRRHYPDDASTLAAVTMKAASLELDAADVIQVLARSPGFGMSLGATDRSLVASLVASAQARLASSNSPAGGGRAALKLRAARRLVGLLLSPVSDQALEATHISRGALPGLKRALAVVGVQLIAQADFGRDDVMVSRAWLAAQTGMSLRQAQRATQRLVQLGWVRRVKVQNQVPVVKLATLRPGQKELAEERYRSVVTALAEGASEPVADIIRAANHPVLGYVAGVARALWVTCLADAAGLHGAQRVALGGTKRRPIMREVNAAGGLVAWLDGHDGLAEALAARTAAEEELAQRGRDHREELVRRREMAVVKKKMRRALSRVYDRVQFSVFDSIPTPTDGQAALQTWAQRFVGAMRQVEWTDEHYRAAAQVLIAADVTRLGWPESVAQKIAALAVAPQEGNEQ